MMRFRRNPLPDAKYGLPKGLRRTFCAGQKNELIRHTPRIGGVEKMKNCPSVIPMALAAITATAVFLAIPWSAASAQTTSSASASARTTPAARASQVPALPNDVDEVMKMYEAGINKDVIVSYIGNSSLPYHLDANGILSLQILGVPQEITKAIIQHDGQMEQQSPQQQVPAAMATPNGAAAAQSTAVCLGVPWSAASAQTTSSASASARTTPAARASQVPALPNDVDEVMKMYEAGINKDVIVSYINNSSLPYRLDANGILSLQILGVPQEITNAMIQHDGQM